MRLIISAFIVILIIGCASSNSKNNIKSEENQNSTLLLDKHNKELTSPDAGISSGGHIPMPPTGDKLRR